ncbi:hypothetical protein [Agrobacterium tumefaciens]|uniref:Uncharacterized protein n=1 Tax=Agrobacterium tumefaciens TaxID=358 RepID=A0A4D7YQ51_AGRTU|nr:hypothetical protein [Agrobacterium tumefaciens]QCL97857.1 hypothetical protein CFBP7129_27120 [Agrobacterium tumefaciens]
MQPKNDDLANPPQESIRPEQDLNRPVSERLDSKFSPVGIDDGDFRGRKRTWQTMIIYALVIFALAAAIALYFVVGTHPGRAV